MLVGQAVVFEPENGMVGFELDGDVSYGAAGENEVDVYTVTYDGNNATSGTAPSDSNSYLPLAQITVKTNSGTLAKTGYSFGGWNTAANGSGITYPVGAVFTMGTADVTLYALWVSE